jgi:hypothetical protein
MLRKRRETAHAHLTQEWYGLISRYKLDATPP